MSKFDLKKVRESLDKINSPAKVEALSENKIGAIKRYRELAQLADSDKVTEENLDKWALKEASHQYSIPSFDLKDALLREGMLTEDAVDQAARELNAEVSEADDETELEKELDRCLQLAKRKNKRGARGDYPNLLIEGAAGFGKTSIVKQWAARNGVHLYARDAGKLSQEQVGGLVGYDSDDPTMVKELGNKSFYQGLSQPNTVLFLDEYNRARGNIRGLLLKLVNDHVLPGGPDGDIFLPNLLFTVAAINPTSSAYETNNLDAAERSRFKRIVVTPNPLEHLKYLNREYGAELKDAQEDGDPDWIREVLGRIQLANTILKDPRFEYTSLQQEEKMIDDPNFTPTNYRSFTDALDHSDGTKESFLREWPTYCDYTQRKTIEDILKDYKDVDDKANDALKGGSKSSVFMKTMTNMDKIKQALSQL